MVKLVIRDDDTNFFTKPEDLVKVYKEIPSFPISYAVVPYVINLTTNGSCPETNGNSTPMFIGENDELITYLKCLLQKNACDILMHGLTHEYRFINNRKTAEMLWKDGSTDLSEMISKAKAELELVFGSKINCFVAPQNKIGKKGIIALENNGMNFSGIIPIGFKRDVSFCSINNYTKRFCFRIRTGFPYPAVLKYNNHLELNACNTLRFDYLKQLYQICDYNNWPMAINVHYWHIRDNKSLYADFFKFIHYALDKGAVPSKLTDCF